MNIYVGNLSRDVSEEELKQDFESFGQISSVAIIKDKFNGQPRGFAFVEMQNKTEAQTAISEMNGKELKGRTLNVNEARPRSDRDRGSSDRSRGGGREYRGGRRNSGGSGSQRNNW